MFRLTTNVLRMTTPQRISGDLSKVVDAAIKADGKSQRWVAAQTGIPLITLNRRLNHGEQKGFTVSELAAVAAALDISVVDLFLRVERLRASSAA